MTGVHCRGSCRVENSHWLQICDEAISFHMKSGSATVSGCSFSNAGNKVSPSHMNLYLESFMIRNIDKSVHSVPHCFDPGSAVQWVSSSFEVSDVGFELILLFYKCNILAEEPYMFTILVFITLILVIGELRCFSIYARLD